jgi:hypothetical protein
VVGNLGRNTRLYASPETPAELYVKDLDNNGITESIITCATENGINYPMLLKTDLQKSVPSIKKKYIYFADYAKKTIQEIFGNGELDGATKRTVNQPNSGLLINEKGKLHFSLLPLEVQFSPIHGIETVDYDNDGLLDLLLTGNFFDVLPELGRYDANYGLVLRNQGKNSFVAVPPSKSGFAVKGQVRNLLKVKTKAKKPIFVLAKNSDKAQVISIE